MMTVNQILVASDFSESADAAFLYGRELAIRFGARVHLLHVAQDIYINMLGAANYLSMAPVIQNQIEEDARRHLRELVGAKGDGEPDTVTCVLTASSPAVAIVEYARANSIDLIVIGTHGRGAVAHLFLGSVAERVVRLAPCPVLTVKHPGREFARTDALEAVTHI